MFFDYPADDEIMQEVMQKTSPNAIHYMNYQNNRNIENILKTFSGMIRYTFANLDGRFNLQRAASALGITSAATETLLEMFEDSGMIKITQRGESEFMINFLTAVELSKIMQTVKYEEFAEIMNTIFDYKDSFKNADLTV